MLLLVEHVRAQGKGAAWIQDALVPLTTRLVGNYHWNRDTRRAVLSAGFLLTQERQVRGGLEPLLMMTAVSSKTRGVFDEGRRLHHLVMALEKLTWRGLDDTIPMSPFPCRLPSLTTSSHELPLGGTVISDPKQHSCVITDGCDRAGALRCWPI